ncbi:crossover junction endodeoxyribonuclease RuvC [Feifania hominis]|uniref:Crossover junction endodeoxyribonuclease RuvC n=1 Tax=Feifania hominis TaxID=2763660 RepID=A0A926DD61_9FIRM|nr:crossover junction endodeoxyribonuclease RuvC [Feifania hominis]MBC8535662.1 crossover junction endodeoxyribonuclease RuvC [Feifania hominis]
MRILGIDPGIASVGYAVVDYAGSRFTPVTYDTFHTPAGLTLEVRLLQIYEFLCGLIAQHRPDAMSVEELFFNTNVTTAIMVGHGRGVILLAAAKHGVPVFEYTPSQVKQAVVGYGKAEKKQVQQMVKMLLHLKEIPKPDDTADAVALAVCHAHSAKSKLLQLR